MRWLTKTLSANWNKMQALHHGVVPHRFTLHLSEQEYNTFKLRAIEISSAIVNGEIVLAESANEQVLLAMLRGVDAVAIQGGTMTFTGEGGVLRQVIREDN
jgi:hypothetical protein